MSEVITAKQKQKDEDIWIKQKAIAEDNADISAGSKHEDENSVIGRKLLLHKIAFPEFSDKEDEFVAVTIIEVRPVPNIYGNGFAIGWKAQGEDGRFYFCNWERFPDDSTSPTWMWNLETYNKETGDYVWYDVCQGIIPLIEKPIFVDKYDFIDYCEKHHELYYTDNGCFRCEYKIDSPQTNVAKQNWKGWF